MNFKNKTVLITGASQGIGRAAALEFARYGASLVLLDINFAKLTEVEGELACEIAANGASIAIYECDISCEAQVNSIAAKLPPIDILVNCAAIWRDSTPFVDTTAELWRRFFDINVMGTVFVTKAVLPSMIERKWGRIINIASVAGVYGNRNMSPYSASKGAVISFSKALAKEVAQSGITVNAISPGSVSPADDPDIDSFVQSSLPHMGRTGTGRENAGLILYLASDEAAYVSGQNIQIDGCRKLI